MRSVSISEGGGGGHASGEIERRYYAGDATSWCLLDVGLNEECVPSRNIVKKGWGGEDRA